jgi:ribosomal peptide maturation radical SAM protein 1
MSIAPKGSILLVVPPFQGTTCPALGVSLLKASLAAQGFSAEILYLNLRFAERIGLDTYAWISEHTTFNGLLGEFIFSYLLFERSEQDLVWYAEEVLGEKASQPPFGDASPDQHTLAMLRRCIQAADEWVQHDALPALLAREPWLVGFTSTFQQNCASLLLMRALKRARPTVLTALGGANCEAEMGEELFARFPEIDYVGQGECDHAFVALVQSLQQGQGEQPIPGILSRTVAPSPVASSLLQRTDLDRLPYPDFKDYFRQLSATSYHARILPGLAMETARGCWWGAKQHCTFCGLNGEGMTFRSKSAPRVLAEMHALVQQYGVPRIEVVDNILDMQYFKTVLPHLAAHPEADIFYEVKANLSREHIQLLARANIKWIQPGIESLSDHTLALMRKGTTALQNIQLLKWCATYGIRVGWNYLYGFPGEREEELPEITQIIQAIPHLEPPVGAGTLHLDRFSPYFMAPERYGLEPVVPIAPYQHVYPFSETSLQRLAYFHQSDTLARWAQTATFKHLETLVAAWRQAYPRAHLLAIPRRHSLLLIDTRPGARRLWWRLTGVQRRVYAYCDRAHHASQILEAMGTEVSADTLQAILQEFVEARLMLQINGRYLSLATEAGQGYRQFVSVIPHGQVRGLTRSEKLRRYLHATLHGTISPWAAAATVARQAWHVGTAVQTTLLNTALTCLPRLLRADYACTDTPSMTSVHSPSR